MLTLYRIDFRSGSGIDPIQCEQYLGKSNRTGPDRSGVELFRTIWDQYLFWSGKSKPTLESKRAIMGFRSKNGANPLNMYRSFTLGAERSKKLSDTERITFGIGVSELSQELRGSNVNRRSIRYGFWEAPTIDRYSVNMA